MNPYRAARGRCRRAFTFVELLVVVGILIALMSILMPALNRARVAIMRFTCQALVKNLVQACLHYADDGSVHRDTPAKTLPHTNPTPDNWGKLDDNDPLTGNAAGLWLLIAYDYAPRALFLCPEAEMRRGFVEPGVDDSGFTYEHGASSLSYGYISMVSEDDVVNKGDEINLFDIGSKFSSIVAIVADANPRCVYNDANKSFEISGENNHINSLNHNQAGQNVGRLDGSARWTTSVYEADDDVYGAHQPGHDGNKVRSSADDSFILP